MRSVEGRIDRRLLVNAFVGVCLLRVAGLRPVRRPATLGRSFDGLAYREVDEPPGPDHASVLGDDGTASAFFVRDVPVRFLPNVGAA